MQGGPPGTPTQQQQMSQQQQHSSAGGKNPSQQAAPDRFGLLGLLSVIRMTDPDLTTLALGTDLTTLGLHLNSPENVYKTFQSPWVDNPLRPEPDFKVPACYLHNPPRLQPGYFSKFQQDTLFFIFYSMPSDEAQLFAADELASRGWWFHREGKVWLTRIPNTEPLLKTDRYERGSYYVFLTQTCGSAFKKTASICSMIRWNGRQTCLDQHLSLVATLEYPFRQQSDTIACTLGWHQS